MAKSFLVIACVCYCTICMHLTVTVLAATKLENEESNLGDGSVLSTIHTNHRQPNDENAWTDRRHAITQSLNRRKANQINEFDSHKENVRFNENDGTMKLRKKRHAGGQHDRDDNNDSNRIELNPNAQVFVRKLFQQFGDGEQETMNVTGFEQMLKHLGLYRMIEDFSHNETKPKSTSVSGITDTKHAVNTNGTVKKHKFGSI